MNKEIDINNEEQILKECDFDYYYNSVCSRELCMFFNDIADQNEDFDKRQARIDLGRIAITLNRLTRQLEEKDKTIEMCKHIERFDIGDMLIENTQLRQQLEEKQKEADQRYKDWQEEIRECDRLRVLLAEQDKEIVIIEKALECACRDVQSGGGAYINAIEAVKGNDVILPVENAMQIEYEIALSELGIVKPDDMPEKYQTKQSKNILDKDKVYFAIDKLEKVIEFNHSLVLGGNYKLDEYIYQQIKELKEGNEQ